MQVSRIDFSSRLRDELDAPFLGDLRECLRADVRGHCGEDDGGGEARVAAEDGFGGVVAVEVATEVGERSVVEIGVGVCGDVDEAAGEGFDGEAMGECETGVESGEFGGGLGCF